ncbi:MULTISPECIES: hypothetical protein [Derxia]|uniref:Uncharacterized protein n=1 Tax=Derxia gummosa DSM 723 TaxID=1121388 RepID=A0A8B6XA55_9BURK|nr:MULTISPECIES: hypothetical protein [Derxia]
MSTRKTGRLRALLAGAFALALAACGSGSDGPASAPVTPSASFMVKAGGTVALMPADATTAVDPTDAASSPSGSTPYFVPSGAIGVTALKTLMNDATTFPAAEQPLTVTVGTDSYKGYRLADVVVRATKFRPADYNTGAFGATTAIVAVGIDGRMSVFSFTELIRTANGEKTIVAYEKNGAALPDAEGAMELIAGADTDPALRRTPRLAELHVRNDYVATSGTLASAATAAAVAPGDVAFTISGAVNSSITVTAATLSATSSQGLYAVDRIGSRAASAFTTYHFQEYGPRHMNYWYGQGVRLTDVLDTAGLQFPAEKNRCFVVITSLNNQPALFSCGELYNSAVGIGDGLAGAGNRSRSKGVLLVTDDFRMGTGNNMMMTCWNDYSTCTKTDAGNPEAYTSAMDANGDHVNYQSIALVSTEDKLPFIPFGRWYPMPANCASFVWKCNAWIDVGERLQQGIRGMTVYYAGASGGMH